MMGQEKGGHTSRWTGLTVRHQPRAVKAVGVVSIGTDDQFGDAYIFLLNY